MNTGQSINQKLIKNSDWLYVLGTILLLVSVPCWYLPLTYSPIIWAGIFASGVCIGTVSLIGKVQAIMRYK